MKSNLVAVVAICFLLGCAGAEGNRDSFMVRDSGGVRIAWSRGPAWRPGAAWRVSESPITDIGGDEGDTTGLLFRVRGAVRLSDGVIVVANGGTRELKLFDTSGHQLRAVGRQGGGPGEFRTLSWLGRYGDDSLVVWDPGNGRFSVFDRRGAFVRSTVLTARGAVRGVFDDGSLLIEESVFESAEGLHRSPSVLWRVSADGAVLDSLGTFPGFEQVFSTRQAGSSLRVYQRPRPFGRQAVFAVAGGAFVAGTQDRFELQRYDRTGALIAIVRLERDNDAVTPSDIAAFQQETMSELVRGDSQSVRRELEELPYPDDMPAHGEVLIDDVGNLWVEEYRRPGEAQPRWLVFDSADRLLGAVETPGGLSIVQIGTDFILGVARDDLDVEHVRLYRLARDERNRR